MNRIWLRSFLLGFCDGLILFPLLLLPSIFPSIKVFSSESVLPIRWPNYWALEQGPPPNPV